MTVLALTRSWRDDLGDRGGLEAFDALAALPNDLLDTAGRHAPTELRNALRTALDLAEQDRHVPTALRVAGDPAPRPDPG